MRNSEKFWDRISHKYAKRPIKNTVAYNNTLEHTKKHLGASDVVLECGCGTGTMALELAGGVQEITGIDTSSKMIEIARGRAREAGVANAKCAHTNRFNQSLRQGSYDAVLSFNVLHLLEDPQKVFRRIHELLRPGGLFISGTVCLREKGRVLSLVATILGTVRLVPYVRSFTISELEEGIAREGFELVETEVFFPSPPRRFIVARKA